MSTSKKIVLCTRPINSEDIRALAGGQIAISIIVWLFCQFFAINIGFLSICGSIFGFMVLSDFLFPKTRLTVATSVKTSDGEAIQGP